MSDEISRADELPSDIDPNLWFTSTHSRCGGGRDYLFDSHWHTHPGRMAAFCPHYPEHPDYRISLKELPADLPVATRYWVAGFLAGNLPPAPVVDDDDSPEMHLWHELAANFAREGWWPSDQKCENAR